MLIPSILPTGWAARSCACGSASVDFREDVRASEELMQRVAENLSQDRNSFRYILGNLDGFDPQPNRSPSTQMESSINTC